MSTTSKAADSFLKQAKKENSISSQEPYTEVYEHFGIKELQELQKLQNAELKTKRVNLLLQPSFFEKLKTVAKKNKTTVNGYILNALINELIREEKKSK